MITGSKKWLFIEPKYSIYLKPQRSKIFNRLFFAENRDIKYYYYDYIPHYEVIINPGDALFVPSYWWHSVDNVKTNKDNLNIGIDIDTIISNNDWLDIFNPG